MVRYREIIENKPNEEDPDAAFGDNCPWDEDPAYIAHCKRMEKEHEIEQTLLSEFRIKNEDWHINDDDTIEAGDCMLKYMYIKKFGVKFNKVGRFTCNGAHNLESLMGSPDICEGEFYISNSKIISLNDGPNRVGGLILKRNTSLASLDGMPIVDKDFHLLESPLLDFGWNIPSEILSKVGGKMFISLTENLPVLRVFAPNYEESKVLIKWNNEEFQLDDDIYKIMEKYSTEPNFKKAMYHCQYDLIKAGFKDNAKW
jgi:hypothetical protein